MEIINDRYRVNRVLPSELYGSTISAADHHRMDKPVLIHILTAGPENMELLQHLNADFVRLSQFHHPVLPRFRRFARMFRADGSPVLTERYLLTSDLTEEGISLEEARARLSFIDVIRVVCELASGMQFLHDRGCCLGGASPKSLRFLPSEDGWRIRYVGLPVPEHMTKGLYVAGHRSFTALRGRDQRLPDAQSDMMSLGLLFLFLLTGIQADAPDFEDRYESTYTDMVNNLERARERKCMSFVGQLLRPDPHPENRLDPSDLIQGLNNTFGTNFPLFDREANTHLLARIPLIDRNGQYAAMIHQGLRHVRNNHAPRIQMIRGAAGTGKTRLIEEIRFQCELKGIPCFAVESTGIFPQSPCYDLVRLLMMQPDPTLLAKYGPELVKLYPEHAALQKFTPATVLEPEQEEMRNRSRLLSFVAESMKAKPSVLLIENLHLMRPDCMAMLEMLTVKLNNRPVWIVTTCATDRESAMLERIGRWMDANGVHIYEKGNFDPNESALFVKRMLGLRRDAAAFSDHIHRETGGNPELIRKLIHILVQDGMLSLDRLGRWVSRVEEMYGHSIMRTSVSFEPALDDSIRQMSENERMVLRTLALLMHPASLQVISLMTGIDQDMIIMLLTDLSERQYVLQQVNDFGYQYGIKSIQQRQTILHRIPVEEQRQLHANAAAILAGLAEGSEFDLTDELIFQYGKSEQGEKVVQLCIAAADRMLRRGAMQRVYDYIDTGIRVCRSSGDAGSLSDMLLRKASLYHDTALFEDEVNLLVEADEILLNAGLATERLAVLFRLFEANFRSCRIMEAERVLSEIEHETNRLGPDDTDEVLLPDIRILRCRSLLAGHKGNAVESIALLQEALAALEAWLNQNGGQREAECAPDSGIMLTEGETIPALLAQMQEAAAWQLMLLGRLDEALELVEASLEHYSRRRETAGRLRLLQTGALACAVAASDSRSCASYLERAEQVRREDGDSLFSSGIANLEGVVLVLEDRCREAASVLRRDLAEISDSRTAITRILLCMNLMKAWVRLGDFEAAYDAVRAAGYMARGSELPVSTTVWIETYSLLFYYLLWDVENLRRSAQRAIDLQRGIPGDSRTEAEFYLYLSQLMSPTQGDPSLIADWIAAIGRLAAVRKRVALWIALALVCVRQGRFRETNRILSCISAEKQKPWPLQQQEIDYLKAVAAPAARRIASLARFIGRLPHDAVRLRYLASEALFHEQMAAGDLSAALEAGVEALKDVERMSARVPDVHLLSFLIGSGALRLQSRVLDLQRDQHFASRSLMSLSESQSSFSSDMIRKEWHRSLSGFVKVPVHIGEDLHAIAASGSSTGDQLESLILRIGDRLRSDWMVFAQFTTEGRLQVVYRTDGLSVDAALAIADRYASHSDFFAYGSMNLLQADNDVLPDGTVAIAGLGLAGEPSPVVRHSERRRAVMHVARRGVLIYGTCEIYHSFTTSEGQILQHLSPLISTLLENHILLTVSNVDRLTGLFTRKYMEETLNARFAFVREHRECLSLLMLDIDHFKSVNDLYTHQRGDEVLRGVAAIAMESCRKQDTCCRFGGEEILIILPDTGTKQARSIAERIRRSIGEANLIEGHPVTVSIGVATYPDHGDFQDEIVLHADLALYHAKNTGRNRTCIYSKALTRTARGAVRREASDMFSLLQEERIMHNYNAIFDLLGSRLDERERMQAVLDRLSNVVPADSLLYLSAKDIRSGRIDRAVGLKRNQSLQDGSVGNLSLIRSAFRTKAAKAAVEMGLHSMTAPAMIEFSQLAVPVIHRHEVIGVLFFHSVLDDHEYDGRDRNIAQLFADLIGLAAD